MGMTDKSLCNSCTNIRCEFQSDIVRTECAFYMSPYIEPDNCGNYVIMQPTVEATPKDQYKARLKADLVAILTELQLEIEEEKQNTKHLHYDDLERAESYNVGIKNCIDIIQQKINALKAENEGNKLC